MRRHILIVLAVLVVASLACGGSGSSGSSAPAAACTPQTFTGSGDDVVEMPSSLGGCSKVKLTHKGERNFIVRPYHGDQGGITLCNEIGAYEGTAKWDQKATSLEIDADGAWTIVVMK